VPVALSPPVCASGASSCATTESCDFCACPIGAIADVAVAIEPGPWVAHVSGGTPLAALVPAYTALLVHPLQTLTRSRGPEQLDGAWGAVTADTAEGHERARWLAETLGLQPFVLADDQRALYHAGASIASNFLVTLHRAAAELFEQAGAPPAALVPLMERTIENGFELTGPIARGDRETVDRHLAALAGGESSNRSIAHSSEATRP